jgi:hypothetical protein
LYLLLQKQIIELEGEVFPSQASLQVRICPMPNGYAGLPVPESAANPKKAITSSYTVSSTANVSAESDEPKDTCYQQKQGVVTTKFPFLNTVLEHALKRCVPGAVWQTEQF